MSVPIEQLATPRRPAAAASEPASEARPLRPLMLALFVASGCSALIYEIVWFQLLQLVIGATAVSMGVLLGVFMGGMCIGSLALSRVVSSRRHPLAVYGLLEIGTAVFGLLVLNGIPIANHVYVAAAGHGMWNIALRAIVCAACLLLPTLLMGATLPAISRYVRTTRDGVSWMGFFYGGNIAGAVFGCLLAGFYLLRVHDMHIATYVAVALNLAVGAVSLIASRISKFVVTRDRAESPESIASAKSGARWIYLIIALSGFTGLGAEVVWTRLLSLLLGGTVYTFSIILAVFLFGLGIGSSIGSVLAKSAARPRVLLGACQLLLAASIAWAAYMLTQSLPYWPIDGRLSPSIWFTFQIDLMRCIWAILPAAILWGASFPLALAAVAGAGQDAGRMVGRVYAANTLGAIFGALAFSLIIIPFRGAEGHGTQDADRVLIAIAAISGLLAIAPEILSAGAFQRIAGLAASLAIVGASIWLIDGVKPVPGGLVAEGRSLPTNGDGHILYVGEGINSSVAVTGQIGGTRYFHVAGKVEASSEPQDMRLQRMLGHIPALLHPNAQRVLVVGCGAGVTAGSFLTYPELKQETICEIEPLIPKVVSTYFKNENYNVVNDPRVNIVYDDARHFVLTTDQTFDIITSDPINPWVKGAATLYTEEYFEMCKQHLAPGGLVTQWVPLYESNTAAVKSQIATFFKVFPNGTIWSNDELGKGYDIVLLGQVEPMKIDIDAIGKKLSRENHLAAKLSLKEVGFHSVVGLLATYGGRASDLADWMQNAEINHDRDLRLQYLAGMDLNSYNEAAIYREMSDYRKFPEDLFITQDGETRLALRNAILMAK
jgi:spermidine synthase